MSLQAEHLEGTGWQTKGLQEAKTKMASECIVLNLNELKEEAVNVQTPYMGNAFICVFAFATCYHI